jgi:hypothetical protein
MIRWAVVVALAGCSDKKPPPPIPEKPATNDAAVAPARPTIEVGLCHAGNWCWTFPRPHGTTLNTVVARAPADVWAAGDAGIVSHWDGKAWRAETIGSERIDRIWPRAADDVWAVGRNGFVARRDAKGWTTIPMPDKTDLYDVRGLSGDDVWLVGRAHAAYHWTGTAIEKVPTSHYKPKLAVLPFATDNIWIGGYSITRWNGKEWNADDDTFGLSMMTDLWATSPTDLWSVDDLGRIVHWDGKAWSIASVAGMVPYARDLDVELVYANGVSREGKDESLHLYGMSRFSGTADDLWLTGGDELYRWDGKRWRERGRIGKWMRASTRVGDEIVAVGSNGVIKRRRGSTWTDDVARAGFEIDIHQLEALADGTAIALGSANTYGNGVLARYDGTKWTRLDYKGPSLGLVARAADDIFTCGHGGKLQHFDGKTWTKTAVGDQTLSGLWIGNGIGWAVGERGTIARWDGTTWTAAASPTTVHLNEVWGSGAVSAWAIGYDKTGGIVLRWDGTAWTIATRFPDEHPYNLAGIDDAHVWMTTNKMLRAWNGSSWEPAPGFPAGVPGVRIRAVAADDVWVAGRGAIDHFDGKTWTREPFAPAGVAAFAATARHVWIANGDYGLIVKRR